MAPLCTYLTLTIVFISFLFTPQVSLSQDSQKRGNQIQQISDQGELGRHHLALFLGATSKEDINAFSFGVDYNLRWHPKLAVGLLLDHATGDLNETLLALTTSFHPIPTLEILLGAGPEFAEEVTEFAFRVGILHEFEIGPITLAPVINIDLAGEETAWVYGIIIGHSLGEP